MTKRSRTTLTLLALGGASIVSVSFWQPTPERLAERETAAPVLGAVYAPPLERAETHVLERGQTLSGVLNGARLGEDMAALLLTIRQFADPRRLAPGTEVTVRRWARTEQPRSIDIRLNEDSTLRIDRSDVLGWTGEVVETPIVLDTIHVSEVIESGESIWNAIYESDSDGIPVTDRIPLVIRLAQVYEFKLDLLRDIYPGDRFRFVYERESRPNGTARNIRILAAEFENRGSLFPAILFDTEHGAEYYDERGHSLRNAFIRYPVEFRITSNFNRRRYHPVLGIYRAHVGTDFGAPAGTPVRATGSGVVEFAGRRGGYGNLVILRHPGGYSTRYAHLRGFARGVRTGARVKQLDVIGYVGATGLVTAAHLHYEFRKNGEPRDVRKEKLPASTVLPERHRTAFQTLLGDRIALLDAGTEPLGARYARGGTESAPAAGGM